MKRCFILPFAVVLCILAAPALAHQPYFEETDIAAGSAWPIKDATISTAVYSTLQSPDDVDYFTFEATAGQDTLLSLTIPQIEGQEDFAPIIALMGPGLPENQLPAKVAPIEGAGVLILPPPDNASEFFEPFSRTSYWTRQKERVLIPGNGTYTVAVYDQENRTGRYVFVIGDREVPGGDLAFPLKMKEYWTPAEEQGAQNQTSDKASQSPGAGIPNPQPGFEVPAALACLAAASHAAMKKRR
ncbi:MAG: hypothetical protein HPY61_04505 [Methanotrichaceae archaeon]|nr:hypothetical protein [Methanotrichaceae archaeon]